MFRYRLQFAKTTAMRFTGHLDLFRAWERTIRRANLPLAYTQGFSPHPRLNLASALPLGFTSDAEVLDLWLTEEFSPAEISARLAQAIPPGIQINSIEPVDLHQAALQTCVTHAGFTVTLLDPIDHLAEIVASLLASESIPRVRRNKAYDLRPLIESIWLLPEDENDRQQLAVLLSAREGATGRPEEVLEALGIPAYTALVHRTALIFSESQTT